MKGWQVGIAVAACACAGTPPHSEPAPAPSALAAPPVPVATSDAATDAAAAELAEPPMPDDEPRLDGEREKLVQLAAESFHVVRGRVRAAKEKQEQRAEGRVHYFYAIVDVLEFLHGDAAKVDAPYRKSFPLFTLPEPVGADKFEAMGSEDRVRGLVEYENKERIFLVRLPSDAYRGEVSWGPPAFLRKAYGASVVSLVHHVPVSERDAVERAYQDLSASDAWVEMNAARTRVVDRFGGAESGQAGAAPGDGPAATARKVAAFVVERIEAVTNEAVSFASPDVQSGTADELYRFALTGNPEATGTLAVGVNRRTARVVSFRLDVPLVKRLSDKPPAAFDATRALGEAKRVLGLRRTAGKVFERATSEARGDGLDFVRVEISAGKLAHSGMPRRALTASLTSQGDLVFEYKNGFATE